MIRLAVKSRGASLALILWTSPLYQQLTEALPPRRQRLQNVLRMRAIWNTVQPHPAIYGRMAGGRTFYASAAAKCFGLGSRLIDPPIFFRAMPSL